MSSALITGAAGGIGRALVQSFKDAGYIVLATDIEPKPNNLQCDHYFQVDLEKMVRDEAYAEEVFAQISNCLPSEGLNALINNAAVQILGGVDELSHRQWEKTLNVNLLAPFFLSQGLLGYLEKAAGCIVNISSIHAKLTKKKFVAYATSKAAISGMSRAMAVDLGSRVRVNAIEPAAIETEMLRAGFQDTPEKYQKLKECHPQHEIGRPEEVASLAVLLASEGMRFMHGSCIGLDGGIGTSIMDPL